MPLTEYYWDELSDNVLMEADENGDPTAVYTNEPGQFGELVSQERGGVESFYHFDGQGSTRELTDPSEAVTDEYTYTAFGETVAESGTTESAFRYNGALGYYANVFLKTLYVRARFYSPSVARWISEDPLGVDVDHLVYRYAANGPTFYADPSGLFFCSEPCKITQIGFFKTKKQKAFAEEVVFENPKGWPPYPKAPDLNIPGPFQNLSVPWTDPRTNKKHITGKFNNVHWIVFVGENLGDCDFERYAVIETKNARLAYELMGRYNPGQKISPNGPNVEVDGPNRREVYRSDDGTLVAIADAPGNNPDPKASGIPSPTDFYMKWNFLIQAKSSSTDKVIANAYYDVVIEGIYAEQKFLNGKNELINEVRDIK